MGGRIQKGKDTGGEKHRSMLHRYIRKLQNEIHQTLIEKGVVKELGIEWRGKLVQGTLSTNMELSQ
jgi:hypothetical protein